MCQQLCEKIHNHFSIFFPHLAFAAFFAAALRCFGVSFSARALPPFNPPSRPSATAAGFLPASLSSRGASPVSCWTMENARSLRSCFLPERFGMPKPRTPTGALPASKRFHEFKLIHYRQGGSCVTGARIRWRRFAPSPARSTADKARALLLRDPRR